MPAKKKTPRKAGRPKRSYPRLIIRENGGERVRELSDKITSIGRSSDNVVEIDDLNSSRHHCQIERKGSNFEISDLKSRNGTLVNGILVLRKELRPGDCVEIGKTRMYFDRVPTEVSDDTIDLATDHFLEPLGDVDDEGQLSVLRKEREIFLKLLEISRHANSTLVLSDLLDFVLDTVVEVTGAERGFLMLREGKNMAVETARNMDREKVKGPDFKVSRSIAEYVLESSSPVLCGNAVKDRRFSGFASVYNLNMKSVLCAPVKLRGQTIGVIYVDNRFDQEAFSKNHLRWLEILSDLAAVPIMNARLFDENSKRHKELEETHSHLEKTNLDLEEKVISKSIQLEEAIKLLPKDRPRRFKFDYNLIVTRSPKMYDIFELLDKVTDSTVPVLVLGESGTGKELVAKAIHENGQRKDKGFVSENCAAIPVNLLESEFFGHVRGAFTGATRDKRGLFEVADQGTLFLDEIADMSPEMQTKFLRVLQDGEIRRVGGKDIIKVNVRIVSATNKNIYDLVRQNNFREDLLYRINVITITLPPLRERREDIPLLIDTFLTRIAERTNEKKKTITRDTFHHLYQYDWPGNIRELINEIERLAALSGESIESNLLSPNILAKSEGRNSTSLDGKTLKEIVNRTVEDVEMQVIQSTLSSYNWKKSKTAEVLGISRPTLDSKIIKYELTRDRNPGASDAASTGNGASSGGAS